MAFQRIRDPLHNLIEFQDSPFERNLWKLIQSGPFQRLRRIKQLGFSEWVYPGATHTRFAHSLGVFHTSRMLMEIVQRYTDKSFDERRAELALTAALLHDVGHGPFSHAFEAVGKKLKIESAKHEPVSDTLIRSGEIADILKVFGSGFANDVADLIGNKSEPDIYSAVVSSQFDADRLDYMRRDRLMTGTHHGAIDFDWLLSNLEIGNASAGVDEEPINSVPTFVLGPKAVYAAETYVLGLFQLYPTVYFHKATRGAERVFSELLFQIVALTADGSLQRTGLSENHPLIEFAKDPGNIGHVLKLDDTVVLGSLDALSHAEDDCVAQLASSILNRKVRKCIDIRERIKEKLGAQDTLALERELDIPFEKMAKEGFGCLSDLRLRKIMMSSVRDRLEADLLDKASLYAYNSLSSPPKLHNESPKIILDEGNRAPYKRMEETKGPLEQILIRSQSATGGSLLDVATVSRVVASIQNFKFVRAYVNRDDRVAYQQVEKAIEDGVKHAMAA